MKRVFILICLVFITISCSKNIENNSNSTTLNSSTFSKEYKYPDFDGCSNMFLSKSILNDNLKGKPISPTSQVYTHDDELVALVQCENIFNSHELTWTWINPLGQVYAKATKNIDVPKGKYISQKGYWHKIKLRGETAEFLPGDWKVRIQLNGETLKELSFGVAEDINELPDEIVQVDSRKYALLIGIEDYQYIHDVPYANNDLNNIKKYFNHYMKIPNKNIFTLKNSDADKTQIEYVVNDILKENLNSESKLFVYFAGHGVTDPKTKSTFLMPSNARPTRLDRFGIEIQSFYNSLNRLPASEVYVFLDTCFSGAASRGEESITGGQRMALVDDSEVFNVPDKLVVFNSSGANEPSNAYKPAKHGLFTYFLLKGLKGYADSNQNSSITVAELFTYIKSNVSSEARKLGKQQNPKLFPIGKNSFVTTKEIIKR